MHTTDEPFVSIVTPVYNGEKFLRECIESVLAQSHRNWEYIVLNNGSTDRTLEIAEEYAQKDPRIQVHSNADVLPIMQNWNKSLGLMSPESKYCKVVHADDWLFPRCVELMAAVAEKHPTVGLVGSYGLEGERLVGDGLPYPSEFVPGRELARMALQGRVFPFLRPTSLLIRSDLIRKKEKFYNEPNHHADHEACYEILRENDYGFVHQVLTYLRTHEQSMTASVALPLNSIVANNLELLLNYGPLFMDKKEYGKRLKELSAEYYRFLAYGLFCLREKKFWEYHRARLDNMGRGFSVAALLWTSLVELVCNPTKNMARILLAISKRLKTSCSDCMGRLWKSAGSEAAR